MSDARMIPPGPVASLLSRLGSRIDHLLSHPPLWRFLASSLVPYLPPRRPSPESFSITFRQESSVAKAFVPIATIEPPPDDEGVAEQFVVFSVDGGEQRRTVIPLSGTSQQFEFPVSLRVGERLSGGFGYVDDSPHRNESPLFAFDITVSDDLDTTAPATPTGFSLAFRQVRVDDLPGTDETGVVPVETDDILGGDEEDTDEL